MLARNFLMMALLVFVGACSTFDDESGLDTQSTDAREAITDGTEGVSGEVLQGPALGTQADLVVNVGDRVFFGYDRYDLSAEARDVLEAQAQWLQQYPALGVTVEGHCDERGTREYNLALGERRANSVKNYLVALGVSPSRVTTISYGKERPAAPGSNEQAWSQNRRGVTKVD